MFFQIRGICGFFRIDTLHLLILKPACLFGSKVAFVFSKRVVSRLCLGWRLYKSLVFDNFKSSARDAVLALIQREREGDPQDSILLKSAVGVFIEMGFKIFKENCIATYKEEFQTSLIAETREFYKGKAKSWLSQDSCPDYMIKVFPIEVFDDHQDHCVVSSGRKGCFG